MSRDPSAPRGDSLLGLARLALPIAAAQLGLVALGLVDVAILGHASVADLAGAALARTVGFASAAVTMGIAMTLEPLASQALGAGDPGRAWASFVAVRRTIVASWAISTSVALLLGLSLGRFGVPPLVVEKANRYLWGQAPGFLFHATFLAQRTFLAAHGRTRPAWLGVILANAVNVVVCNLLVRGDEALMALGLPALGLPRFGAFGAGLASTLAYGVLALVGAFAVRSLAEPTPTAVPARAITRLGVPIGMQLFAEMGVFSLSAVWIGHLGASTMSAHQIAISLASFTYMGAVGVSGATAVVVGRAIGAGADPQPAGRRGLLLGVLVMAVPCVAFLLVPERIAHLFTDDAEVSHQAAALLRIAAAFQLFDGVQATAAGALRGAADVKRPFVINVVAYWAIGLPVGLGLASTIVPGAAGLWWGLTLGIAVAAVVLPLRFFALRPTRVEAASTPTR